MSCKAVLWAAEYPLIRAVGNVDNLPVACKTAFCFLRNVSHGADQYILFRLCCRGHTLSIMASCCPLTTPAICLGDNVFPAGLRSAKGVTCSPASCLACSWPVVTWETVRGEGGCEGSQPPHCPDRRSYSTLSSQPTSLKPTAPVPTHRRHLSGVQLPPAHV